MARPLLILGLDGAGYAHLERLCQAGITPNLARMASEGTFGPLISTTPPITGPAWLAMATGLNVSQTGIADFLVREPGGFDLRPISSRDYRGRTVWDALGSAGARVAVYNFPLLYPPYAIDGIMVSGFGTDEKTQWTYPEQLKADLLEHVGSDYALTVNYHHEVYDDASRFLDDLEASLERRLKAAEFLCRREPWDAFFCVLSETDWLLHRIWSDLDPDHPLHDPETSPAIAERARGIWRRIDAAIPALLDALGPDASLLLCSDHGFGPNTATININALLEKEGLLVRRGVGARKSAAMKRAGVSAAQKAGAAAARVPGKLGRVLTKVRLQARRYLPKDDTRFLASTIDYHESTAFDPGHTIPFAGLYVSPRLKRGGDKYIAAVNRVEDVLFERADRADVRLAINRAYLQAPVPHESLPDLIVSADDWAVTFSKTEFTDDWLVEGPFSQRHTGSHRVDGVYLGWGARFSAGSPGVRARITDIAPTILASFGLLCPEDRFGTPLAHAKLPESKGEASIASIPNLDAAEGTDEEDEDVRERLRGLGYIE